ncbi:MAG: hypothetical protein V9F03_05085 [Microthrixaceae bacterium]
MVDAIKFGVTVRVVGLLPRFGSLECHIVRSENLAETFPADVHNPCLVVAQIGDQFAETPPGEWLTKFLGSGCSRRDDELLVVNHYLAGTATRPLRVQRRHPFFVEPVDHLANPVLRSRDQLRDRGHRIARR